MFFDDLLLVKTLAHKYEARGPFVECGGIPDPTIADYTRTIEAMRDLGDAENVGRDYAALKEIAPGEVADAQMARYLRIHRPLSFLDENYVCEDPATGGLPLERLCEKYHHNGVVDNCIGTAILLSVLEHVADPFEAIDRLRDATQDGGLAIVSVPFSFPFHPECGEDNFRFTPSGLRHVFTAPKGEPERWSVLEADWRLDVKAEDGVIDLKTGRAQIIKSCYIAARAV